MYSEYHYFFNTSSPFSNFHPTKYHLYNQEFFSSEQGFMYAKAVYFNDIESAKKILRTKTPKEAKELGRQVKNFNEREWEKQRYKIMCENLYAKFHKMRTLKHECGDIFLVQVVWRFCPVLYLYIINKLKFLSRGIFEK